MSRQEVHDRRTVEIAYVLLSALVIVGVPALVGHLVGLSSTLGYRIVLVVLAVAAGARAVRQLWRFELRLRRERTTVTPDGD
jgi:hypothetical protein